MTVPMWVSAGIALAACMTDLRTRRVPNALTLGAALAAVAFHAATSAGSGLLFAVLGWGVALDWRLNRFSLLSFFSQGDAAGNAFKK